MNKILNWTDEVFFRSVVSLKFPGYQEHPCRCLPIILNLSLTDRYIQ